jgi:hypothetical protein
MSLLLWGLTVGTVGKLILGVAVLRVHTGILHEHRIDNAVLKSMKRERFVTLIGLSLIAVGYIMEVIFYSGSTQFFSCSGPECVAAVNAAFSQ